MFYLSLPAKAGASGSFKKATSKQANSGTGGKEKRLSGWLPLSVVKAQGVELSSPRRAIHGTIDAHALPQRANIKGSVGAGLAGQSEQSRTVPGLVQRGYRSLFS